MTTIAITLRSARVCLAASLLGGGLLIAATTHASAGEITPTTVSAPRSQVPTAGQSAPTATHAPATDTQRLLLPVGAVGFGWG